MTAVASHLNWQHHQSTANPVRSFASTPVSLAKKRGQRWAVEEEEGAEEDKDEGELFGSSSTQSDSSQTASHVAKTSEVKEPFAVQMQKFTDTLEERGSISNRWWCSILGSANSVDEVMSWLDLGAQWRSAISIKDQRKHKPGFRDTAALSRWCQMADCPELEFHVLTSREKYGMEYSLETLRVVQNRMMKKLRKLTKWEVGGDVERAKIAKERLMESEAMAGATKTTEEWEGGEGTEVDRAKLSLIDRTLALTAFAATTSADQSSVDYLITLHAISGMLRTLFMSTRLEPERRTILERQIHRRLSPALDTFLAFAPPSDPALDGNQESHGNCTVLRDVSVGVARDSCRLRFGEGEDTGKRDSILAQLETFMGQGGPERQKQYADHVRSFRQGKLLEYRE